MRAAIVDYGMGNLASVTKALERAGARAFVSDRKDELSRADLLVLPGVGNFAAGMRNLASRDLDEFVRSWAMSGNRILGICLGLQLLFDHSEEGGTPGLGVIPGRVEHLPSSLKVPHMGWNTIETTSSSLFSRFLGRHFYFVHSYVCVPEDEDVPHATTVYGEPFVSAVDHGSVVGFQFHPEKSSGLGLELLSSVLEERGT